MNRFFAFVKKEFFHILRDRRTLLILFGMPLAMVLLFGFALTNEIKNAKVAVLDFDHGQHSRQLTDRLLSSGYFQLTRNLTAYRDVEATFRQGHVKLVVIFPVGFTHDYAHGGKAQVQLLTDASEQNTAITLTNYATNIIQGYQADQNPSDARPSMQIEVQSQMVFNPELKGAFVFVPGVMSLVLLLVSALMTSITIAREKETGTMEVLMVSPLSQLQILFGKVLPYLLLSFINGCIIIALGVFLLGIPLNGSLLLLLSETLLFIFLSLSLGLLVSTLADTQLVAMFISMLVLLLPTIFLSGFLFPIDSMPRFLQIVSTIIPARYFIDIVKGIMIKGVGLADLWRPTLVLFLMATVLMAASLKNLKPRLN
ncbi:ABC transporter permease [Spirosoma spitsbergense]|uniref:ABC transporter permease n=1 Tax=Spirosoma spitsbergense TaxID=431554 RepID=UPI0004754F5E|nr:ABC transporter permease [Spirosoma spitsbergense]